MQNLIITIDDSEFKAEMNRLRSVMTEQQFANAMAGIFRRTGSHVKKILRTDLPKEYNITGGEVGRAVRSAQVTSGGGLGGCTIPVVDPRRHIGGGGRGYPARGSARGWNAVRRGKYPITTHIYRGSWSTLPYSSGSYAYPPFRNVPSKLNGIAFHREAGEPRRNPSNGKWEWLPINPVMGPAIPQMPMNRSEADVQNDIRRYMEERMEARLQALIAGGR